MMILLEEVRRVVAIWIAPKRVNRSGWTSLADRFLTALAMWAKGRRRERSSGGGVVVVVVVVEVAQW